MAINCGTQAEGKSYYVSGQSFAFPFAISLWFYIVPSYTVNIYMAGITDGTYSHYIRANYGSGSYLKANSNPGSEGATDGGAIQSAWTHALGIWVTSIHNIIIQNGTNRGELTAHNSRPLNTPNTLDIGSNFQGYLADVAYYDLSVYPGATNALKAAAFEAAASPLLSKGYSALFVPLGLRVYAPLVIHTDPLVDWVGGKSWVTTATPPTTQMHPRIRMPGLKRRSHLASISPVHFMTPNAGYW